MQTATVAYLLKGSETRLGISRMFGDAGFDRPLQRVDIKRLSAFIPFAGFSENVPVVAVLACGGTRFGGGEASRQPIDIPVTDVACLGVPGTVSLPSHILDSFRMSRIPCFLSHFDKHLLESRLTAVCREKIHQIIMIQGTLVRLFGQGVLLTGESGTGKTSCSIRLAVRGHAWVADDIVVIRRKADGSLCGQAHPRIAGLIEFRGKGLVPAEELFGPGIVLKESPVDLIVSLQRDSETYGRRQIYREIMGARLPLLTLPVTDDATNIDACIVAKARSMAHKGGESS